MPDRDQRKCHLALGIDVEHPIYFGVHKAAHDSGRKIERCAHGQQVGEQCAVVPAKVAVGACLILPGVTPVGSSADDDNWSVQDRRLGSGRFDQHTAIVASTQLVQTELAGSEVIKPRFQIAKVTTREVEFDLIESTGCGGSAEINL